MLQVVVLIPKGLGGYRGIFLVEVVWKVVMVILNSCLAAYITFHDILREFQADRGTGTASLEAKILQQLTSMREEVMYVIFLGMYNSYDALDR